MARKIKYLEESEPVMNKKQKMLTEPEDDMEDMSMKDEDMNNEDEDSDEVVVYGGADEDENQDSEAEDFGDGELHGDQDGDDFDGEADLDAIDTDVDLSSELDGVDDLEDEEGLSDEDDMDMGDESELETDEQSAEEILANFRDAFAKLLGQENPMLSQKDAVTEATKRIAQALIEDASAVKALMKLHQKRSALRWEPSDFKKLAEDLQSASGEKSFALKPGDVDTSKAYLVLSTKQSDSGVHVSEILKVVEDISKSKNFAESENRAWEQKHSQSLSALDTSSVEGTPDEGTQHQFSLLSSLQREYHVIKGSSLQEFLEKTAGKDNHYVFVSDEVKETLGLQEKYKLEDVMKTIKEAATTENPFDSLKDTRKTPGKTAAAKTLTPKGKPSGTEGVISPEEVLKSVFNIKLPSQQPKRRGDKRNSQALQKLHAKINSMSARQVKGMYEALSGEKSLKDAALDSLDFDLSEEVKALKLADETLNEAFLSDAAKIFESAVREKVKDSVDLIDAWYMKKLSYLDEKRSELLVKRLDSYLDYVVENYMQENKLAIEDGLKQEVTEGFFSGLKSLFERYYVSIPEGKRDLLGELEQKVASIESKLNEETNRSVGFKRKSIRLARENAALKEARKHNLTAPQTTRLMSVVENLEFISEKDLSEKVSRYVKENILLENSRKINKIKKEDSEYNTLMETRDESDSHGSDMDKYVQVLNRKNK